MSRESHGAGVGRAAVQRDLASVTACLASAFYEDPVWAHWAFPDESSRRGGVYELMQLWAAPALRYPWVRMTDHAEAVAVWIPPGKPEMTSEQEERFSVAVGELFGERASELNELLDKFEAHHPHEPHYYLSLWGTHRDHAGKGVGTALIEDNLARIDAEGMPAYLESTNPANLPRYEALGFTPTGRFGPSPGPVITTMWREARAALQPPPPAGATPQA